MALHPDGFAAGFCLACRREVMVANLHSERVYVPKEPYPGELALPYSAISPSSYVA